MIEYLLKKRIYHEKFNNNEIDDDILNRIVDITSYCPIYNKRIDLLEIIIIKNKTLKQNLLKYANTNFLKNANTVILITFNKKEFSDYIYHQNSANLANYILLNALDNNINCNIEIENLDLFNKDLNIRKLLKLKKEQYVYTYLLLDYNLSDNNQNSKINKLKIKKY